MPSILDIETEGLVSPQKIWVTVLRDTETNAVTVFKDLHCDTQEQLRFRSALEDTDYIIGHNLIQFDWPVLVSHVPGLDLDFPCVDTLVVSRLLHYDIEGGHSLEAWGNRLGYPKSAFSDFSKYSLDMEKYCIQDTLVTLKLYQEFSKYIHSDQWKLSLAVEHDIAKISREMSDNGFAFDIKKAKKLQEEIEARVVSLDNELVSSFHPRTTCVRVVTPKATKHGTLSRVDFRWSISSDLSAYSVDAPFSLVEWIPFNPGSPKQIVERLNEAGWKPFEKTKGHQQTERELRWCKDKNRRAELEEKLQEYKVYGWKVSEDNLKTLPADAPEAARKLVQRLLLASRRSTLETWIKAYKPTTERIHGSFNHIGAWTGRMSHNNPNIANIPSGDTEYAHDMRCLWRAGSDRLLVGVDADGIQLRVLAHYMDDPRFTEALINGDKKSGTDAHTLNRKALGEHICKSRDDAKTFIYAWLLGAGILKIASILGCTLDEAAIACNNFLEAYPGLHALKTKQIPADATRGYFLGLDQRLVVCNTEHLMLAGYLQNGESVIMKHANVLWRNRLIKENVPFKQVNFVHDEWQTETVNDLEIARYIARTQADSIREVGEMLGLKCPLAGSTINSEGKETIGLTWYETH